MSLNPLSAVGSLTRKVFGSRNDRLVRRLNKSVAQINAMEERLEKLSDEELAASTEKFRERLGKGERLDALLPEAFAVVREAGRRVLGMRHFDVQMVGGMVLHQGKIAEMKTGEGKTLVATLPAYLNALPGKGVHVITVNDYLARRDADWMGQVYRFLGLSVGVIVGGMDPAQRKEAYAADITYGTNNEFGFDYLRDNMAFAPADRVQRGQAYAIVDEVDSILIDEARTPLIISGPTEDRTDLYVRINTFIPRLEAQAGEPAEGEGEGEAEESGDYYVDEKAKQVYLTEAGHERIEAMLTEDGLLEPGDSLYAAGNISLMHHVTAALRAHTLFRRDVEYVVKDRQVVIVDEFTGRTMPGRRWSEGLHQAIEAKEGVPIQSENQTLASITFQNYFRLYETLAGMTGTADTEAYEFQEIYGLEVVSIPTHRPMVRKDMGDLVYLTTKEKFQAIIEDIEDCRERKQPVLVGTTSIETSELLSRALAKDNIPHQVLNAKFHAKEAEIVAQAGRPGAVTIATNMAGRGTDIVLGGSPESEERPPGESPTEAESEAANAEWQQRHDAVIEAGGLHIIGTERHESRRIDNQLRGRSGRQGDPGSSRFYLSLEDNLMRIFASERLAGLMQKLGMQEGEAIEHPWVSRAIENAQRKVEGRNFDIRKQLLEFDDVANDQRKVIYKLRNDLMNAEDVSDMVTGIRGEVLQKAISQHLPPGSLEEQWDIPGLEELLKAEFALELPVAKWLEEQDDLHEETLRERIEQAVVEAYTAKEAAAGAEVLRHFEKAVMLQVLDQHWREHLAAMDHLRQGIHLRGYAQKNPKQEYKREAFALFTGMLDSVNSEAVGILSRVQVKAESDVEAVEAQRRHDSPVAYQHAAPPPTAGEPPPPEGATAEGEEEDPNAPFVRQQRKVGRNEPCPCGSGRKYKQCHGRLS